MTKENKSFEQEIDEILVKLLPYSIQDEQRKIYKDCIIEAHKSSLERIREKIDAIQVELNGIEPADSFKLQSHMNAIIKAKQIIDQELGGE